MPVLCTEPVSQRYDYGWGDGVVPEEHRRIMDLDEVPIGILVDLRPFPLPFVSKLETLHFLGAYCGVRILNSRPDTPVRYRLDILDTRASMAEGTAAIAALEAAGVPVVITSAGTSNNLYGAIAEGLDDDEVLGLVTGRPIRSGDRRRVVLASGASRDVSVSGALNYGKIWHSSPSYCHEVYAILRFVRYMGWRLFSVVRTLDVYGNTWAVCYNRAVRAIFPDGDAPTVVCNSALNMDAQAMPKSSFNDAGSYDPITGLGKFQSTKAHYHGITDAVQCIANSHANIVVLWMRSAAAHAVFDVMRNFRPATDRLRIIGTADWATFRPSYLSRNIRLTPDIEPFLRGAVYFKPSILTVEEQGVVNNCVASIKTEEHPFVRDAVEELDMCRIPRPYTPEDPKPDIADYDKAPECKPGANLAGLIMAPQGYGEFGLVMYLDKVYRQYGAFTQDTMRASGLFSKITSGDHALRLMQLSPRDLSERYIGRCTKKRLYVTPNTLEFGVDIGTWYPAYRVDMITPAVKTKLTAAILTTLALSLACHVLVFALRRHAVVRKSSPALSQIVLLGIDITLVAQLIWNEPPATIMACTGKVWVFLTGIGLVLGALLARLYRLDAIFNRPAVALAGQKRDMRDHIVAARIVVPVVAGELAVAALCTFLPGGPPKPWIDLMHDTKEAVWTCNLSSSPLAQAAAIGSGVLYNAALVIVGIRYAIRTRAGASAYSEPRQLAMTVYFYALACAVFMPLYYAIFFMWRPVEENAADGLPRYRVLAIVMCALGTILILFVPKVAVALSRVIRRRGQRTNLHHESPQGRVFAVSAACHGGYAAAINCGHH